MLNLKNYSYLLDENIKIICNNRQTFIGKWIDWTSAQDNEPDPESITIEKPWGAQIEIFVRDIREIFSA